MAETTTPTPWFTKPKGRQPRDPERDAERRRIRCGTCNYWWTGLRACHCSGCHRTFTGLTAFDMHREGDHAKGTRHCVNPASVGLVPANRPWQGWGQPGTYDGPYEEDA